MPMTKAQIETALDLLERFVEAHEAIAQSVTMMTVPQVEISAQTPPADTADDEPDLDIEVADAAPATESSSDEVEIDFDFEDEASAEEDTSEEDVTQEADDVPIEGDDSGLDLTDKKAVDDFRAQLMNVLKEFAKEGGDVPDLIESVTGSTRKFSEVAKDMLEELHDAAHDAMAELD